MESAELSKKSKRIRHCYPRREVYHRFIHDDTLVYHNKNKPIAGVGNLLIARSWYRWNNNDTFINNCKSYADNVIAVIDRTKCRILINISYSYHIYDLLKSIPDNFEIFYTDYSIDNLNILQNDEELYKTHARYLVKTFIKTRLALYYNVLNNRRKVLNVDINKEFKYNKDCNYYHHSYINYNDIVDFVKKYNIKNYYWYKTELYSKINNSYWYDRKYYNNDYPCSSLKRIIENKVFSKKEKHILECRYFYTNYCYKENIPFKDVELYYGTDFTLDQFNNYCNKKNLNSDNNWYNYNINTWENFIKQYTTVSRNIAKKYIEQQILESASNYKKAIIEANELNNKTYSINDWREGKLYTKHKSVDYEYFEVNNNRRSGRWVTRTHTSLRHNIFNNIQLKLDTTHKQIVSSRGVCVSLEEGIKVFKLFTKWRYSNPKETQIIFDKQPRVGIYNLRFIRYKEKVTDIIFNPLGFKDWVIQIGCHSLWLTDIEDFIKYYNLEKEFGLTTINK